MKNPRNIFTKLSASKLCILLIPAYAAFYLPCFILLEKQKYEGYHIIHMTIDDLIPFNELFVIPYLIWFIYMIFAVAISFFTDRDNYVRSFFYMASGMTLFILVSFIYPNCHELRPVTMPRNNIFCTMVAMLQNTDVPANLLPSIHVYNSIAAHMAIINNRTFKKNKRICTVSLIICISIILSTLFIKQHSMFDIITAIITAAVLYPPAYEIDFAPVPVRLNQLKPTNL
jgi:membrane-associated phospholipid phosphatase